MISVLSSYLKLSTFRSSDGSLPKSKRQLIKHLSDLEKNGR